jgi:diguanylate cyclase (GGDEF)-like protein
MKRAHALHLWLIAIFIVGLAGLVAFSITALREHADRARQVQLLVAEIDSDAQRVSRIEWQAAAGRALSEELDQEFRRTAREIHEHLDEYDRESPADARELGAPASRYLSTVERQLALLTAGRVAESEKVDARDVDPSFEGLQHELRSIDAEQSERARGAAAKTDIGVTVSMLLAALLLIAALRRLDSVRGAAALERQRDLEIQALQDALTGLPNRRKLLLDLEQEVLRAGAGEGVVLVLCDLDGFKAYNDTFGHLEGDLLLGRLSEQLARTVAAHGTAYRLGGDEFCALVHVDHGELEPLLRACHDALHETGSGFEIRASIGSAALPAEASDSSTALRLADERMYAQKQERGAPVGHRLPDVILRVLALQDPELYDHVHQVAKLAGGVGRRLGLDDAQVANLVRAAELHDVGKFAIPDSILHKPGPLDADEQEFIRRHTLIGQSILSAAPMLAGVGQLVRSSHERYDGTGYPDGLRDEDIPLSSRIIFVCDSFDAMTTERPYREAMNEADALTELTRCASTQFDPAVVDAFVSELAALKSARQSAATA